MCGARQAPRECTARQTAREGRPQTCEKQAAEVPGLRVCCARGAPVPSAQRQRDACNGHRAGCAVGASLQVRSRPQLGAPAMAVGRPAGLIPPQQQGFGQRGRLPGGVGRGEGR